MPRHGKHTMPDRDIVERFDDPLAGLNLDTDRSVSAFVVRLEEAAQDVYSEWLREARTNLAWFGGRQSFQYNDSEEGWEWGQTVSLDIYKESPRTWTNFLRHYAEQSVSRIIDAPFIWDVYPENPGPKSLATARIGDKLLPHVWNKMGMMELEKFPRALHYVVCTGIAYAHVHWRQDLLRKPTTLSRDEIRGVIDEMRESNPDALNFDDAQTEEAINRFVGPGQASGRMMRTSDGGMSIPDSSADVTFLNGYQVVEDWTGHTSKDWRYVMTKEAVSVDLLRMQYPGFSGGRITGDVDAADTFYDSTPRTRGGAWNTQTNEPAWKYVIHTVPIEEGDTGWKLTIVNKKVVKRERNPFPFLPIIPIIETTDCYDIRPQPRFTDLRRMQARHNFLSMLVSTYAERSLRPATRSVLGQIPDKNSWDDPTRRHKEHNHIPNVPPPSPFEAAPLPADVWRELFAIENSIKMLGGITDVSQGQESSKATSGRAIIALSENAASVSKLFGKSVQEGLGRIGKQVLAMIGYYMDGEQIFRLSGGKSMDDVLEFNGEDFIDKTTEGDGSEKVYSRFDVKVTIDSPRSVQYVMGILEWLIAQQVINPQQHSKYILAAISQGELPTDLDIAAKDRANASRVNEALYQLSERVKGAGNQAINPRVEIMQNEVVYGIQPGDDPEVHLTELYDGLIKDRTRWEPLDETVREFVLDRAERLKVMSQEARASAAGVDPNAEQEGGTGGSSSPSQASTPSR